MSRTLLTWNDAVMDAAGKPHVSMLLNALVLIALPPSIWLGSAFGIEGVAVAFCLAALHIRRDPVVRDHHASTLLEGAERARTCSGNRASLLPRHALPSCSCGRRSKTRYIDRAACLGLGHRRSRRLRRCSDAPAERGTRTRPNGSRSPARTAGQELSKIRRPRLPVGTAGEDQSGGSSARRKSTPVYVAPCSDCRKRKVHRRAGARRHPARGRRGERDFGGCRAERQPVTRLPRPPRDACRTRRSPPRAAARGRWRAGSRASVVPVHSESTFGAPTPSSRSSRLTVRKSMLKRVRLGRVRDRRVQLRGGEHDRAAGRA